MEWLKRLFGQGAEDREGEPRGGMSAEAYHTADPRDIVEEDGVAMAGPAGAPQEETTPAERRAEQRNDESL